MGKPFLFRVHSCFFATVDLPENSCSANVFYFPCCLLPNWTNINNVPQGCHTMWHMELMDCRLLFMNSWLLLKLKLIILFYVLDQDDWESSFHHKLKLDLPFNLFSF